jgi:hypothetical protein
MKNSWRRTLTTLGFTALIAATAPACVFTASARVRPAVVVYEEPPAPRNEVVRVKAGHVWVQGRWEWQNSRWVWKNGYFVRARTNYSWEVGRWEQRGNQWHWVEGRWVAGGGGGAVEVRDHRHDAPPPDPRVEVRDHRNDAPPPEPEVNYIELDYPTREPPAPQADPVPPPKSGYIWVYGNWDWQKGVGWKWTAGHWERKKAKKAWKAGYWELRGNRWFWVSGEWTAE